MIQKLGTIHRVLEREVSVSRPVLHGLGMLGIVILSSVLEAQVSVPTEKAAGTGLVRHGLFELDEDLKALAERLGPPVVTIEVTGLATVQNLNRSEEHTSEL